jgi:hypothetical protein
MTAIMTAATKAKTKQGGSVKENEDAKQLAILLEKAMQQPGVKDVVEVYGKWTETNEVAATFQAYLNPYPPSTVTSSSEPTV